MWSFTSVFSIGRNNPLKYKNRGIKNMFPKWLSVFKEKIIYKEIPRNVTKEEIQEFMKQTQL